MCIGFDNKKCRGDIAEAIGMYRSQSGYDAKHIENLIRSVSCSNIQVAFCDVRREPLLYTWPLELAT